MDSRTIKAFLILAWVFAARALHAAEAADVPRPALPGWSMRLLLAAPQVRHPSVVCTAPDGRIFIGEDPMDIATPRADVAEGRILCRHPDGRVTVFADKLYAPFGLKYLEGKLYVLHNPKFSVFDDGGDKGLNRTDLIEQTNPNAWALEWNDHVPANFRLGMDGYFYMAVGDKGIYGAVGRDGKRVDLSGGGILRLKPDGTALEVFCRGVRNIMDVAINSEDELFTYDNTDEHEWMGRVTHMVEDGFYGYPHDFIPQRPYTLWCFADLGAGAATGTLAETESGLPSEYRDNLFLADFGKRQVIRVRVGRDGGTYRVEPPPGGVQTNALATTPVVATIQSTEPLFMDPPEDFRPVGIAWHAEGTSLLICDWQHRDSKDTNAVCGRLWELAWTGPRSVTPRPDWYVPAALGKPFQATHEELLRALGHPAREVRLCAQRRLSERMQSEKSAEARAGLTRSVLEVFTSVTLSDLARVHALWALDGADEGRSVQPAILAALKDPSLVVRRQVIRYVGLRRVADSWRTLMPQLWHEDASIRRAVATAMGRMGDMPSGQRVLASLDDADLFARYAKFTALNRIGRRDPRLWTHIVRRLETERTDLREGAMFALRDTYDPQLLERLTAAVHDAHRSITARETALELIAAMHRQPKPWAGEWGAYHPFRNPPPPKVVPWPGTERVLALLKEVLHHSEVRLRRRAILGLGEAGETNAAPQLRESFAKESDMETRKAILQTLGGLGDAGATSLCTTALTTPDLAHDLAGVAIETLERIATTEATEALVHCLTVAPLQPGPMLNGVRALGRLKPRSAVPFLTQTLRHPDPQIAQAAIQALGRIGGNEVRQVLEGLLNGDSPDYRRDAIQALGQISDKASIPALLKAWENPSMKTDVFLAVVRMADGRCLDILLEGLGSRNPEHRAQARSALKPLLREVQAAVEARIPTFSAVVLSELQVLYREVPSAASSALLKSNPRAWSVEEYLAAATRDGGSVDLGHKLFTDATGINCIGCHRVAGQGGDVGPDLSGIGAQSDRRALAESILFPSRVVREGYQRTVVELRDGDEMAGLVKSETTDTLTLRDAAGQLQVIRKADVRERRQTPDSMMPEGLQTGLSLDEFRDLIAYLASLRGASPKP